MMYHHKRACILSIVLLVIDRVTKCMAYQFLSSGDIILFPSCSLSLTYNTGIAWSILANHGQLIEWSIIIGTLYFLYHLGNYVRERVTAGYSILGEMLVLLGGFSNLCDRFLYPGVVDFIRFSYDDYTFPLFNIADLGICLGVGVMMYHWFDQE